MHRSLTSIGVVTARPIAFVAVSLYTVAWLIFDRGSFDMHGGAALGAWFMTLFIQRAAHRDTQAIQAKLDELLRAHGDARSEMADLDQQEPEDIEDRRAAEKRRL
ncbi:MAG: low affinity iron permease family protein [Alphaproteobacteria bacterium]|nr:low affinity iron permease family protein [Alphaproteobacteria bacterium]MBU1514091.1 low affinity iron permease family protein [Alphaproteobacteria bacterium]MBU2096260.1 low affinity iron permease family protein [Alphaproteobacteria bacterium]MBU2152742.1 low affinity iron permease family protein [Alphaproteobacteria bacterium]MBU2308863.1 low affinity iron permease family protein [Alphaproteobacteria bacterium]